MKYVALALFVGTISAVSTFAQVEMVPIFAEYRVPISTQQPKPPNLKSHKGARLFRTNLRSAAKAGVNFAGHYALTYWGCGTACLRGAIINLKTGHVFFPDELHVWGLQNWKDDLGFGPSSRLLVLKEYRNGRETGTGYYEWTGTRFRKLIFAKAEVDSN